MKKWIGGMTLLGLALAGWTPAEATDFFDKVATFDGQFLKIPVGARATAMGGAFVAVADDASAVYWNPAGIARLQGNVVAVNHLNWVADVNMTQGTYVFKLSFLPGMLAVDGRALYMSEMERTTVYRPDGDGTKFDAGYSSFGLTYARSLTDKFSVGGRMSLVHAGLDDVTSSALAVDIGTLYDTGYRAIKIGMQIANMGFSELSYIDASRSSKLPIIFRVGASINLLETAENRVVATGEFSHPPDNSEHLNFGGEWWFKDFLALRGGYFFGYDAESFSAGIGVKFPTSLSSKTRFDYAYTDLGDLSAAHRFSLEVAF